MSELKRCPFCGGNRVGVWENHSVSPLIPYSYEVRCYDCHFGLAQSGNKEEAIEKWNTRKPMDRIVERLKEVAFADIDETYADDAQQMLFLHDAIEIVKEEGGLND